MSIKQKIEQLDLEQRRQLSHAFDHEFSQFVKLNDDEFIGVNINPENYHNLEITEQVGVWSTGKVKE